MSARNTGRLPNRSARRPKSGPPTKTPISGEAPTRPSITVDRCRSVVRAAIAMPTPPMM